MPTLNVTISAEHVSALVWARDKRNADITAANAELPEGEDPQPLLDNSGYLDWLLARAAESYARQMEDEAAKDISTSERVRAWRDADHSTRQEVDRVLGLSR